jgi:hypothetical protein
VNVAISAHRHPSHIFRAARHDDVAGAGCDLAQGRMDRGFGRSAFAIDCHTGDRFRPAGRQQCGTCNVTALLAYLCDAAKNYIAHDARLQLGARQQLADRQRAEMIGANLFKTALKSAYRRPGGFDDNDIGHSALAFRPEPGTFLPFS